MVKDHLGNEYVSERERAEHYGLPASTVRNRLGRGWTLEEALTVENKTTKAYKHGNKPKIWKDHLGNEYRSVRELAEAYGLTEKILWGRWRNCKDMTLEESLTTPVKDVKDTANRIEVTDHLGNTWPSISEMCRHWNIRQNTYRARIKMGFTVEEALTRKIKQVDMTRKETVDHLGNVWPSINKMCEHYGITKDVLRGRLERGWKLEKALTHKEIVINNHECTDFEGNTFPTMKDMANYYGFNDYDLQGKYEAAPDKKEFMLRLIRNRYRNLQIGPMVVIKCIQYPYFRINIGPNTMVMHFRDIIKKYHESPDFDPLCGTKLKTLQIVKLTKFPYYMVMMNGNEMVMSYWDIIKYKTSVNFGLSEKETKSNEDNENAGN